MSAPDFAIGEPALARLIDDVERWMERREDERLVLYRRWLQCTVRWASPLLADAIEPGTLAIALDGLGPPRSFPDEFPEAPVTGGSWFNGAAGARLAVATRRNEKCGLVARLRRDGAVLRPSSHPLGMLGVAVMGASLELAATTPRGAVLATHKASARLDVPGAFPDVVGIAMVGRDVDAVVDHPLLAGRGYVVQRATTTDHSLTVFASTGQVRHEMPWPGLAARR